MRSLRENIDYSQFIVCPNCDTQVQYHVTDMKGIGTRYIICPECGCKIHLCDEDYRIK